MCRRVKCFFLPSELLSTAFDTCPHQIILAYVARARSVSFVCLGFTIQSLSEACVLQILALPAKRVGFFAVGGALIARSDSNGEDLEAFAGAGKPWFPCPLHSVDVAQSELFMH